MRVLLPVPDSPAPDRGPADRGSATSDAEVDLHAHYGAGWLEPGGVRANFVASVDGAATAGGLSRALQTPGDNRVFAALRDLADVILVGASTAAAEGYRPANPSTRRRALRSELGLAEVPGIAVMSSTLQLDLSSALYAEASKAPTLVITGSATPVAARNDIIDLAGGDSRLQLVQVPSTDDGGVDFAAAVDSLRELGYRRILCEGGPRLFAAGVAAGAVDEVCLTVSPRLVGPGGPRIVTGDGWPDGLVSDLELSGLLIEDDALFCRYRVRRPTPDVAPA